jgi:hypothetical protein
MRRSCSWAAVPALGIAAVVLAAVLVAAEKDQKKSGPPPLVIEKGAPLLLDEPAKKEATSPGGRVADNQCCYVCHTNYQEEFLVTSHAKENVGCVNCHGQCFDHRNDEDNITPPDIMYPAAKIDAGCGKCHEEHDVAPKKLLASWQERCPAKTNPKEIVCTDCHGQHRLKLRTVRWDKETRKLITRTGEAPVGKKPKPAAAPRAVPNP